MLDWIGLSADTVWWMMLASAAMFGLGILAVPFLIARIPADYFLHDRRLDTHRAWRFRWLHWMWIVIKNVLGLGCLFFGALMLVLPGQGTLTILIGVVLLDFPGKYRLEVWIVRRKGVLDSVNWVRRKAGASPLSLPEGEADSNASNGKPT